MSLQPFDHSFCLRITDEPLPSVTPNGSCFILLTYPLVTQLALEHVRGFLLNPSPK